MAEDTQDSGRAHSSSPVTVSSAVKNTREPETVNRVVYEENEPGTRSWTCTVPASVPSLRGKVIQRESLAANR